MEVLEGDQELRRGGHATRGSTSGPSRDRFDAISASSADSACSPRHWLNRGEPFSASQPDRCAATAKQGRRCRHSPNQRVVRTCDPSLPRHDLHPPRQARRGVHPKALTGTGYAQSVMDPAAMQSAPPVTEVAVAVEFEQFVGLGTIGLARLAEMWQADYPVVKEVAGAPPGSLSPEMPRIQFGAGTLAPRLWLLTDVGNDLVQIQNDRLIVNWRRLNPADEYPGHAVVLGRFIRLWNEFREAFGVRDEIKPRLIEWTYINQLDSEILARKGLTFVDDALEGLPGTARHFAFHIARELQRDSVIEGYLTIEGGPAMLPTTEERFFSLNITTKLDASQVDLGSIPDVLARAHELSLAAFTSVISPSVQGEWSAE